MSWKVNSKAKVEHNFKSANFQVPCKTDTNRYRISPLNGLLQIVYSEERNQKMIIL